MSRIDDLIAELCPDGVEFQSLREVGKWYGGGTPSKGKPEYWADGTIPWLSPQDMVVGKISVTTRKITEVALATSTVKLVPSGSVAFVVRSNILRRRLPVALVPTALTLNQDMRAVVPYEGISVEFLAHLCRANAEKIRAACGRTDGSMAAIAGPALLDYRVPIPPMRAQREIVSILDALERSESKLEAELEAELEARRRQYEHYRDSLVSIWDRAPWALMGDVGVFFRGRRFTKADVVPTGIASIHYGEIYTRYGVSADRAISHVRPELAPSLRYAQQGDLVIAGVGETVDDVGKAVAWLGESQVAIHDDCFAFRHTLDPKYVAYYFQTAVFHAEKDKFVARAKVKRLSGESLAKMRIPVPPLEEQQRIVKILDIFDVLVDDISFGLSAEIVARRKQYEYCRDKLLTFDEVAST